MIDQAHDDQRAPAIVHHIAGDRADTQARYLEAAVSGIVIASLYAPNGNPQPGPKFDYKLAWLARLAGAGGARCVARQGAGGAG